MKSSNIPVLAVLILVIGVVILPDFQAFAQDKTAVITENSQKSIVLKEITLCKTVKDREPVDKSDRFRLDDKKIYCFSVFENEHKKQKIFHKWYREGVLMLSIELKVGLSKHWRTWSSKNFYTGHEGAWEVTIVNQDETELGRTSFKVKQ
ncbi:DUF2914 domain-containing protein [bacterium]|nr:DUF2914 domain-containing protein [bacterium]